MLTTSLDLAAESPVALAPSIGWYRLQFVDPSGPIFSLISEFYDWITYLLCYCCRRLRWGTWSLLLHCLHACSTKYERTHGWHNDANLVIVHLRKYQWYLKFFHKLAEIPVILGPLYTRIENGRFNTKSPRGGGSMSLTTGLKEIVSFLLLVWTSSFSHLSFIGGWAYQLSRVGTHGLASSVWRVQTFLLRLIFTPQIVLFCFSGVLSQGFRRWCRLRTLEFCGTSRATL